MGAAGPKEETGLLTCWKDIARYMGKGVRTVQRWEQTLDLPVRRPRGNSHKSAVLARAQDLDTWLESRWSRRNHENGAARTGHQNGAGKLDNTIEAAHRLRAANQSLIDEVRTELDLLVRNCDEMRRRGAPEPGTEMFAAASAEPDHLARNDFATDHLAANHSNGSTPRNGRNAH